MWSAFRSLAERIGLSPEKVAEVERAGAASLVGDPLNPEVQYRVRPDADWTERLGEAWNGTLTNSRKESAGSLLIGDGLLTITKADVFETGITVQVAPGEYDVTLVIAHSGAEETYDYEEHVSHAFALLRGEKNVVSIEPLEDEHGVEIGVVAYAVAFAGGGVFQQIAGHHAGRWTLRMGDLLHPKSAEGNALNLKSAKVESDDGSGAAIILHGGYGRGDYPVFRLTNGNGETVGVMVDFFVDNRPW